MFGIAEMNAGTRSPISPSRAKANRVAWTKKANAALAAGKPEVADWIIGTQLESRAVEYKNGHLQFAD